MSFFTSNISVRTSFIISLLILLGACNPKVSKTINQKYPALDYRQEVFVLGVADPAPENGVVLGKIKVGDSGFTIKCDYHTMTEKAKVEARKIGGNIVKITQHTPPSLASSCHRISANIIKIDDLESLKKITTPIKNSEDEFIEGVDYAVLKIYRPYGLGPLIGYNLYLGDNLLCRVKNNFKTTLKIKKDGLNKLWAKTESVFEIPIDIKIGKIYYIKCGLSIGAMVGRPKFEIIDNYLGKAEFESLKSKNK